MFSQSLITAGLIIIAISAQFCIAEKPFIYTNSNFEHNINNMEANFVMFYAPWCKYCTEFEPIWNSLADLLNFDYSNIAIAQVDCTKEQKLCLQNDVTGYPTLLFFKKSSFKGIEYKGTRDLPALSRFINAQMNLDSQEDFPKTANQNRVDIYQGLAYLDENSFDKFVARGQHFVKFYAPWCLQSQRMAPTWADLAAIYEANDTVKIGKVDCTRDPGVCQTFEIKDYPHMAWIVNGKLRGSMVGHQNLDDLKLFIDRMALPENHVPATFLKQKKNLSVARISEDTFDMYLENNNVLFINFFASWCAHCKLLSPTWIELGKRFADRDDVIIAEVDCSLETTLCLQEKIIEYPTIMLYRGKELIDQYKGVRTTEALTGFVNEHLQPKTEEHEAILKDEL